MAVVLEPQISTEGDTWLLLLSSETLNDMEKSRCAMENRLRAMRDVHGIEDTPEYARMEAILEILKAAEKQAATELVRALRKHPLGKWVKKTIGVGEKQAARLLAALDDPYIRATQIDRETGEVLEDARPRRGPAELWAYCGYVPGQKRQRGVKSNWNAQAKMRAFLIAESVIKQDGGFDVNGKKRPRSPYRDTYDAAKAHWADKDTSDGHRHNHALRVTAKEILKDLYLESKRIHERAAHNSDLVA